MDEEEEEADLEAIQAHMEMTMALTYEAVEASLKNSTLPDEQIYESLSTFKPRPPRMGIGDMRERKGESSSLARDTARLHGRLAGKKRAREEDDVGSGNVAPLTNGVKKLKVSNSTTVTKVRDSDEEDESRTATISTKVTKQSGTTDRFALPGKKKKKSKTEDGGTKASDDVSGEPVFAIPTLPISTNGKSLQDTSEDARLFKESFEVEESTTIKQTSLAPKKESKKEMVPPLRSTSPDKSSSAPKSPVVSLSSSTSRYSRDMEKRLLMKQEALASWRLVHVEKVTVPTEPVEKKKAKDKVKEGKETKAKDVDESITVESKPAPSTSKSTVGAKVEKQSSSQGTKPNVPVLQLEPLAAAPGDQMGANVMEGEEEQPKKKKRRRKKNKKKQDIGGKEVENNGDSDEQDSG